MVARVSITSLLVGLVVGFCACVLFNAFTTLVDTTSGSSAPQLTPKYPLGSLALNPIDGRSYPHHPVMLAVPYRAFRLQEHFLVEPGGLLVPAGFDCDNLRKRRDSCKEGWDTGSCTGVTGNYTGWKDAAFPYFDQVPSRWYQCRLHEAQVQSQMRGVIPALPIVDEEYYEHVAVFQSVLRSRGTFVMVEMGARWGTWGSRAAALHRSIKGTNHALLFYEPKQVYCDGIAQVVQKNNLQAERICDVADSQSFRRWASGKDHIDLVDIDIQKGEKILVPQIKDVLDAKAYRLIIGTHSPQIHEELKHLFRDWIMLHETRHIAPDKTQCVHWLRMKVKDWKKILQDRHCYTVTSHGPVVNYDGELILDNPRFVKASHRLEFASNVLQVSDLL